MNATKSLRRLKKWKLKRPRKERSIGANGMNGVLLSMKTSELKYVIWEMVAGLTTTSHLAFKLDSTVDLR